MVYHLILCSIYFYLLVPCHPGTMTDSIKEFGHFSLRLFSWLFHRLGLLWFSSSSICVSHWAVLGFL